MNSISIDIDRIFQVYFIFIKNKYKEKEKKRAGGKKKEALVFACARAMKLRASRKKQRLSG